MALCRIGCLFDSEGRQVSLSQPNKPIGKKSNYSEKRDMKGLYEILRSSEKYVHHTH